MCPRFIDSTELFFLASNTLLGILESVSAIANENIKTDWLTWNSFSLWTGVPLTKLREVQEIGPLYVMTGSSSEGEGMPFDRLE